MTNLHRPFLGITGN